MYSRNIYNINDVFEQFTSTLIHSLKKCNKSNSMEFHFKPRKDILNIFCSDANDINIITYKEIQICVLKIRLNLKSNLHRIHYKFKNHFFDNYVDELNLLKTNV
jgi:hypothetical protein